MSETIKSARTFSPFLLMIILIAFILSLSALYIAFDSLLNQSEALDAYSFLAIGFGGIALTVYMLFQTRSRPKTLAVEVPKVLTTLDCPKCDFKNIRNFQKGDFIFKKTESCQKCKETMVITAIYKEEKKKTQS